MNFIERALVGAIWGASFLFMRIGAPEFGPFALAALRVAIAALVLSPVLCSTTARTQLAQHVKPLFVVGMTNSAMPFCLFAYAMLSLSAGFESILNATAPLWGALIAYVWLRVPLTWLQAAGLLIGLAGVAALVWDGKGGAHGLSAWAAIIATLGATLCYGFAANYAKQRLAHVLPGVVAFGGHLSASAVLLPLALLFWPARPVSAAAWYAVGALGILCTGIGFMLYFRLVKRAGAAYAMSSIFLVPIFGTLWGVCFLCERVTLKMILGCAIILVGTMLASGAVKGPARLRLAKRA
ncbi:conserved membrane hypothetical protein [Candidatus Glomeribacter gigasporarum BEG34]|uniref:EamA domain-containing protein n=1 Tax=Candidatus Glomeribacter gigasporarum BEG34 TaxID=1070319 RepID=G2J8Q8_9BURK|nr:DMT family transporter [Candidatus Glomeribacter gigasporarum]CCD29155.1 conserved membrane hypothetical protein [Candidatus Glomeribacter gigasporarum BEG34]